MTFNLAVAAAPLGHETPALYSTARRSTSCLDAPHRTDLLAPHGVQLDAAVSRDIQYIDSSETFYSSSLRSAHSPFHPDPWRRQETS
jgi:hypothetical protein